MQPSRGEGGVVEVVHGNRGPRGGAGEEQRRPVVELEEDSGDGSKVYDPFEVRGHCNGLVLLQDSEVNSVVVNPAMRQ